MKNFQNQLRVYPVPKGALLQRDFLLRVRPEDGEWQSVPIFQVKVDMHDVREASWLISTSAAMWRWKSPFPLLYRLSGADTSAFL